MAAGPKDRREIEALLRASGYSDEWHVRRIVETALLMPAAGPGQRMVDLGTHPAVLNVLAQAGGWEDAVGVDSRPSGPESWDVELPSWGGGVPRTYRIHNRDLQRGRLPFADGSVDLVTCFETLEHLLDPMHMLIEANRILRVGGALLLTTPNVVSWRSLLRAAVHKHPLLYPVLIPGLDTNRHNIEYTPHWVRILLKAAGFAGRVETREWWYRVSGFDKARLVLAGFRPGDRGDIIVVRAEKRTPPLRRHPEEIYKTEASPAG